MRLFILVTTLLLAAGCIERRPKSEMTNNDAAKTSEVPDIAIALSDGTRTSLRALKGKKIAVLFQPDCDHCQREAVAISERLADFKDYPIYMISSAEWADVKTFAENFGLAESAQVRYAVASVPDIVGHFGSIPTPSLYIYSDNDRLLHSFNGEVDVEVILRHL